MPAVKHLLSPTSTSTPYVAGSLLIGVRSPPAVSVWLTKSEFKLTMRVLSTSDSTVLALPSGVQCLSPSTCEVPRPIPMPGFPPPVRLPHGQGRYDLSSTINARKVRPCRTNRPGRARFCSPGCVEGYLWPPGRYQSLCARAAQIRSILPGYALGPLAYRSTEHHHRRRSTTPRSLATATEPWI